jgi:2'-5' RNA ligase
MRLFIAISLSKKALESVSGKLKEIIPLFGNEVKFTPDYKWHFTLVFLGQQEKEAVDLIKKAIKETVGEFEIPKVTFGKITYGPPGKNPRMIWLGLAEETNVVLAEIKKKLVKNLADENVNWKHDERPYKGHITLARFEPAFIDNLPDIEKELDFSFQPSSIELIKSVLKPTGAEYETIFREDFKS